MHCGAFNGEYSGRAKVMIKYENDWVESRERERESEGKRHKQQYREKEKESDIKIERMRKRKRAIKRKEERESKAQIEKRKGILNGFWTGDIDYLRKGETNIH